MIMEALRSGTKIKGPTVLFVNQFALLPADGGGTRHFELGRELVQKGWQVTVIASDLHLHTRAYSRRATPSDRSSIAETVEGVDFKWLWSATYHTNNWRRAWNWLTFWYGVRRARRGLAAPAIVLGSSPQLLAAHAARFLARSFGVPFVLEVRDLWPESLLAAGGKRGVAHWLLDRLAWSLYRDADRILVLAKGTQDYLVARGLPVDKFIYVPNGVDVHAVAPSSAARTAEGPFIVLYAGAHGPANGLDRVLDAAEILRPVTNVRFLLVGDGPMKHELMRDARLRGLTNVEFREALPKSALVELLHTADAGLMVLRDSPLFSFGVSPNKLFDYFAAGLPVVCNVRGEVAQMVKDADAGVQASDASGAALAAAVLRMAEMAPSVRRRMAEAGRDWVKQNHSRQVLGGRLDQMLRKLI
jgi:glycosyltransferase involved in cell wall biosynthesis